jgi:predicted AAA+ superfamily ATPase
MYRAVIQDLRHWKQSADRKPLVLQGARQVGKTYILKEFGRSEYAKTVHVSFDRDERARQFFNEGGSAEKLIRLLSAHSETDITPEDTLVILDEIQECPAALEALKYFHEETPQYHIVVAGSLLGISLHGNASFPVGKVDMLRLFPMTYEEFLVAMGRQSLLKALQEQDWEIINSMNEVYIDLLRQYYYVGGMPEAVLAYSEERGLKEVRQIQERILAAYRYDFSKHAPSREVPRINMVWDSIPSQLAKDNKKFIYGALKKGARAAQFEEAIQWLIDAGLVYKVSRVSAIKMPLKFYEEFSAFKLFLLDVGLMGAMVNAPSSLVLIGNDIFKEYKGAFTEVFAYTQLVTIEIPVYYHSVDDSTIEIDFAVQIGEKVYPVEVKAETNLQSKSLKTYMQDHPELKALRLSMQNHIDQGWVENLPLFAFKEALKLRK